MHHILCQQAEERFAVTGIEGGIVTAEEIESVSAGHEG
jgi:hypothetical protein